MAFMLRVLCDCAQLSPEVYITSRRRYIQYHNAASNTYSLQTSTRCCDVTLWADRMWILDHRATTTQQVFQWTEIFHETVKTWQKTGHCAASFFRFRLLCSLSRHTFRHLLDVYRIDSGFCVQPSSNQKTKEPLKHYNLFSINLFCQSLLVNMPTKQTVYHTFIFFPYHS